MVDAACIWQCGANLLTPMFLAFDYPTPFTTIGRRGVSNVPAQALAMMNNPFRARAGYIMGHADSRRVKPVACRKCAPMYLTVFCRPPEEAEERAAIAFIGNSAGPNDPRTWSELWHVLFNVKEFIFVP